MNKSSFVLCTVLTLGTGAGLFDPTWAQFMCLVLTVTFIAVMIHGLWENLNPPDDFL